jgi:hypothetical protein
MHVDRDLEIEKERKIHEASNIAKKSERRVQRSDVPSTAMNWKDHKRNSAKSLVHFLSHNKSVKKSVSRGGSKYGLTK